MNHEWLWAALFWRAYQVGPEIVAWLNLAVVLAVLGLAYLVARRESGSARAERGLGERPRWLRVRPGRHRARGRDPNGRALLDGAPAGRSGPRLGLSPEPPHDEEGRAEPGGIELGPEGPCGREPLRGHRVLHDRLASSALGVVMGAEARQAERVHEGLVAAEYARGRLREADRLAAQLVAHVGEQATLDLPLRRCRAHAASLLRSTPAAGANQAGLDSRKSDALALVGVQIERWAAARDRPCASACGAHAGRCSPSRGRLRRRRAAAIPGRRCSSPARGAGSVGPGTARAAPCSCAGSGWTCGRRTGRSPLLA
jgi:hypothetical protein